MNSIAQQLKTRFAKAFTSAFGESYADTDLMLAPANNPNFGDFQCNAAMSLGKKLGKPPRAIASAIVENLDIADICETPEIAGPGFINLKLKPAYLEAQISAIAADTRLGISPTQTPQRIAIDFSSPNIAKEMHVGHLRSTIIGDAIARTLEFQGHDVIRINHIGDWGTQFGMLIAYLREVHPEALTTADALDLGDLVAFYRQAKQRFDTDETFKETARQEVVKLQAGAEDTRRAWKLLCAQSRREFQVIYDLLDIKLTERGESFYNPLLPAVVEDLTELGLLVESDGAKCVFVDGFTNKEGEPLPLIIQKSDGGYNYATTDLAAVRYRIKEDGAKRIIYVTDSGQANHFAQVFAVARKAGWIPEDVEIVHVPFGLVSGEDGKRLKTRGSGDIVRLQDLLDEAIVRFRSILDGILAKEEREETAEFKNRVAQVVGISAVKYADLSHNRISNYMFSYDQMLAPLGNTAPYLLYAYVRVRGIGRKGGIDFDNLDASAPVILQSDAELVLAKHLLNFSEVINAVESDLLPNRICQYLFELSQKYNQFFEQCPVLKAEEPLRSSRLLLCDLTARSLKLGLGLLGIQVLERM
jgi:arginyl-tRNA synthetase